ncbi:hypothetical protein H5410_045348 [Solanum commersonii]|uniref:Uncharacterized protein n=1 Tax=Solanum commersonii TaxID=4109 RepID=A0A9J5XAV7_SOLCO|nr:hypothetical protein H5410_045348 [Solanum commersonii]
MNRACIPHIRSNPSSNRRGNSIGGTAAQEREKPSSRRLLIIKEKILRGPKSSMYTHNPKTNHQSRNKHSSNREPSGEKARKSKKGKWVCEEGKGENNSKERKVIDTEIGVVFADTESGVGDRFRFRESGPVKELGPWPAIGKSGLDGGGDVVDE